MPVIPLLLFTCADVESGPVGETPFGPRPEAETPADRGVRVNKPEATQGYVLFAPLLSDTTFLIDQTGTVVHTWRSDYAPAGAVYLRDNGNLLRGARVPEPSAFSAGGQGGRLQEFTWDGEIVWDWLYAGNEHLLHHDVEILPNGNILAIAWEARTYEQARDAGRRSDLIPEAGLWPDMIIEIQPLPPDDAQIVWEWHAWDHLIQDTDPGLAGYGDPARFPERIDVNGDKEPRDVEPEEIERLKALGYLAPDTESDDFRADWLHTNAISYNVELDQIAISTLNFSEIWVIDHSTTTEEAADSTGGRWGRGGDLLYRWGNPMSYGRGDTGDQRLFKPHDVRWVSSGLAGAGNLMVFNNDVPGPTGNYSTVVEITPPTDDHGRYVRPGAGPFGPAAPTWTYSAPDRTSFYSWFVSGAHRLANGNTMICSGAQGRFFEVTREGEIVWEYWDRHSGTIRMPDGSLPHPVGKFSFAVFRATKIPLDHPALAGRKLMPLDPQPSLVEHAATQTRSAGTAILVHELPFLDRHTIASGFPNEGQGRGVRREGPTATRAQR